jgi:hypothetical protein
MFEVHFKDANAKVLELKKHFFMTAHNAREVLGFNYKTSLFFRGNSFDVKHANGLDISDD